MSNDKRGCHRGQILSNDLVIALSVFMAIVLVSFYIWNLANEQIGSARQVNSVEQAALFASDSLVQSQGNPPDWEYYPLNSTVSIGLASERNVISQQKLDALQAYNSPTPPNNSQYERVKEILGVGGMGFHIGIEQGNGTAYSFGEGVPLHFNNSTVIAYVVERPVAYNNTPSTLIVEAWQEKY
ncbi:MAG: hypothetical protein WC506_03535 [Candidatus Micrarchaeia archaeon]